MRFYWVIDIIRQNRFHIFWKEGKKNSGLCHKILPSLAPYKNETKIFKSNNKYIENSKDWQTETGKGCIGTTNPRGTRKPDNPLKVIRNPIPWKIDNALKGIRNLVPNGIRIHIPRGLTVPT